MRAPKPRKTVLQESLRSKARNWVDYRNLLPPKNPAGHREAKRRIAKMHESHIHPPTKGIDSTYPQGRNQHQTLPAQ